MPNLETVFYAVNRTFEEVKYCWTKCRVKSISIMVKSLKMNIKESRFKSQFPTSLLCDLGQLTCLTSPTLIFFHLQNKESNAYLRNVTVRTEWNNR